MRKSFYTLGGIVTDQMGLNVQNGDAFIFINRNCTSMKILHMECGGLVVYHLKLEQGVIYLPDMTSWEDSTCISTAWTDLIMMVEGIYSDTYKSKRLCSYVLIVKYYTSSFEEKFNNMSHSLSPFENHPHYQTIVDYKNGFLNHH